MLGLVLVIHHGCSADRELGCYLHAEPPRHSRGLPCLAARHRLQEANFTSWLGRSERFLPASVASLPGLMLSKWASKVPMRHHLPSWSRSDDDAAKVKLEVLGEVQGGEQMLQVHFHAGACHAPSIHPTAVHVMPIPSLQCTTAASHCFHTCHALRKH